MKFASKRNTVEADSVYCDKKIVANDVSVSLPEITFQTADIAAMGTMSLPMLALIDNMELSITRVGIDRDMAKMSAPGRHDIEVRWVQDVIGASGKVASEGCKAFLSVLPTKIPGIGVEIGSAPENELTYSVSRYKLVCAGKTVLLIDRFAHKFEVNGKDYYKQFSKYL